MDLSEQYLEMCKQAKEIQDIWNIKEGDYILHVEGDLKEIGISVSHSKDSANFYVNGRVKYTYSFSTLFWIPRQDQLQDLSWNTDILEDNIRHLLMRFNDTINGLEPEDQDFYWTQFSTFEQLWITFYMWTKHYKIWNGEHWIKKEEKEEKHESNSQ